MRRFYAVLILATAVTVGGAGACAHYTEGSAAGEVIDPADAAKTVVLHVDNQNPVSMELRTIVNGRSEFIGSVSGADSTDILLDPSILPTGNLYVLAIPADGRGRAVGGPLALTKGDRINFTVTPELRLSRAIVTR